MKKQILTLAGVLSLLVAVGPVYAQQVNVKGNIPFEFKVGDQTLPAGTYSVVSASPLGTPIMRLVNDRRTTVALILCDKNNSGQVAEGTALVFHRYGDRYFLAHLRIDSVDVSWDFPRGKAEIEEARHVEYQDTLVASTNR